MKKAFQVALFTTILIPTISTSLNAQELIYVAVEPCRLVDTREAGGAIAADSRRNFFVSETVTGQGGSAGGCPAPEQDSEPLAISAYVIAVPTPSSINGVLTAYPSDQLPPPPGAGSTVNFAAGQVIGNTTNITLCDPVSCPRDGEFAILARNTSQHVVVDVQGYFYPASPDPCPAAAATRFVDNGDGTICDSETGLMWERKDAADGVEDFSNPHDVDNRYTWTTTDDGDDTNPDGTAFTDFLARLNGDTTSDPNMAGVGYAGHTDWRLPNSVELQTLLFEPYPCSISPCIIDPTFTPTGDSSYWSSTSADSDFAWSVNFHNGVVFLISKELNVLRVRAVRGGR